VRRNCTGVRSGRHADHWSPRLHLAAVYELLEAASSIFPRAPDLVGSLLNLPPRQATRRFPTRSRTPPETLFVEVLVAPRSVASGSDHGSTASESRTSRRHQILADRSSISLPARSRRPASSQRPASSRTHEDLLLFKLIYTSLKPAPLLVHLRPATPARGTSDRPGSTQATLKRRWKKGMFQRGERASVPPPTVEKCRRYLIHRLRRKALAAFGPIA
jgi:hypothetical protein